MRKVKDAIDLNTGEKVYFRGHAQSTYMSDGRNVEEAINEIPQGGGSGVDASLVTLPNGNIKVTINGVSKDFMAATPSGDPLHEAYIEAGAKWNDSENDVSVATPWASLADDAADKVVTHKAKHWLLNGLGDLTNRDMRRIYNRGAASPANIYSFAGAQKAYITNANNPQPNGIRTNLAFCSTGNFSLEMGAFFGNEVIEVGLVSIRSNIAFGTVNVKQQYWVRLAPLMRHIIGAICPLDTNADAFTGSPLLKTIDIQGLKYNINFKDQPLLTNASILNMINKEKATNAITITLHADAYARAMADAEITAALAAHPNVSLAKA